MDHQRPKTTGKKSRNPFITDDSKADLKTQLKSYLSRHPNEMYSLKNLPRETATSASLHNCTIGAFESPSLRSTFGKPSFLSNVKNLRKSFVQMNPLDVQNSRSKPDFFGGGKIAGVAGEQSTLRAVTAGGRDPMERGLHSCVMVGKKAISDYGEEQMKTRNKEILAKVMRESRDRSPAYYIGRPKHHNNDPIEFNVKGIKEIIDFNYINQMNSKSKKDAAIQEMYHLIKKMKKRNSKQRLKDLKEEWKALVSNNNGSPTKKKKANYMYQITEKIKELEKNTSADDVHSRFQLLQQYLNQYKERICQNSQSVEEQQATQHTTFLNDNSGSPSNVNSQKELTQQSALKNFQVINDNITIDYDQYLQFYMNKGQQNGSNKRCTISQEQKSRVRKLINGEFEESKERNYENETFPMGKSKKSRASRQQTFSLTQVMDSTFDQDLQWFKEQQQLKQRRQQQQQNKSLTVEELGEGTQKRVADLRRVLAYEHEQVMSGAIFRKNGAGERHSSATPAKKRRVVVRNEERVRNLYTQCLQEQESGRRMRKEIGEVGKDYNEQLDQVDLQLRITSKQIVAGQLKYRNFSNFTKK